MHKRLVPLCVAGLVQEVPFPVISRMVEDRTGTSEFKKYFPGNESAWREFLTVAVVLGFDETSLQAVPNETTLTSSEYQQVWMLLSDILQFDNHPGFLETDFAAYVERLHSEVAALHRQMLELYKQLCELNQRYKTNLARQMSHNINSHEFVFIGDLWI